VEARLRHRHTNHRINSNNRVAGTTSSNSRIQLVGTLLLTFLASRTKRHRPFRLSEAVVARLKPRTTRVVWDSSYNNSSSRLIPRKELLNSNLLISSSSTAVLQ